MIRAWPSANHIPSGTFIQHNVSHFYWLLPPYLCVSRYVCSRCRPWTSPQTSPTASQLRPTAPTCKPWISCSITRPPWSLHLLLCLPSSSSSYSSSPSSYCRPWKPGTKRGDWMPDVPRLLHPGHPESADDRPEQPGDGQEHPARVCLHPLHGTHRHIVASGASILSVSSLSPLCAIIMDSIYQALSCRATSTCQKALLWGVMLRSRHIKRCRWQHTSKVICNKQV